MKNCLVLIFIFIMSGVNFEVYSINEKNAVYLNLDDETQEVQEVKKGRVNMEAETVEYRIDPMQKQHDKLLYEDVNRLRPEKKAVSKSLEKEVLKGTSVGATYSTTENSGELKDSVSVYSKYQKKNFGLTTSYSQDRDTYKEQGAGAGTVSVSPEISLNKHVKLKNVYSENMSSNKQKSEVVLSIRPFKDDRMDFDLGAGETFSNGNEPAKSQINIGTKFRF